MTGAGVLPSTAGAQSRRKHIEAVQAGLKLCGEPRNGLLQAPAGLLGYLSSILRDEPPRPPDLSREEWSGITPILRCHSLLPLFYYKTSSLPAEARPPAEIQEELRIIFLESVARSLRLEEQLEEIIQAFREKGIRTLVMRGPALARSIYPEPALRQGSDLDLLVLPEHLIRAREILEELGYTCLGRRFETARDFYHAENFQRRGRRRDSIPVDLHWIHWKLHPFLESSRSVGVEDLLGRAVAVKYGRSATQELETLDPVDSLLHAALHLALLHSRDMRLIWIYDIALLARGLRAPEDWEILQERSVAWRARLSVERCLAIAAAWTGLRVPEGFDDFSRWPSPAREERMVWSHARRKSWVTLLLRMYLARPPGLFKMARSLLHLLFPPPAIVRHTYQPSRRWLLPLSYLRRLKRLFRELVLDRGVSAGSRWKE